MRCVGYCLQVLPMAQQKDLGKLLDFVEGASGKIKLSKASCMGVADMTSSGPKACSWSNLADSINRNTSANKKRMKAWNLSHERTH